MTPVWLVNMIGIGPAVMVCYLIGASLFVVLAIFVVVPFVSRKFDASGLTWNFSRSRQNWKLAVVLIYIDYVAGWTITGIGSSPPSRRSSRTPAATYQRRS
jgi:hypothetical protein